MNVKVKLSSVLFAALCASASAYADVRLHRIFTDHMVLQCDMNVNVWGWADPGEKVSVEFGGQNPSEDVAPYEAAQAGEEADLGSPAKRLGAEAALAKFG